MDKSKSYKPSKKVKISISLREDVYIRAKQEAEKLGGTLSGAIEHWLSYWLEEIDAEKELRSDLQSKKTDNKIIEHSKKKEGDEE